MRTCFGRATLPILVVCALAACEANGTHPLRAQLLGLVADSSLYVTYYDSETDSTVYGFDGDTLELDVVELFMSPQSSLVVVAANGWSVVEVSEINVTGGTGFAVSSAGQEIGLPATLGSSADAATGSTLSVAVETNIATVGDTEDVVLEVVSSDSSISTLTVTLRITRVEL